jgi:ubiquinone/menaquinone biosynthesis C-methylase UbiE
MTKPSFHHRLYARVMRVFFSLLYHTFAWTYDFVAAVVSLGNWKKWIMCILPEIKGPQVLELGHGPGHLQVQFANQGIRHFGIDASPQMGLIAYKLLRKNIGEPPIARAYAQSLPFPGGTFHHVVATFPSEYILNPYTIKEAFRVLVPGGKFVILPTARITGNRWIEQAAAWLFKVTGQSPDWDDVYLKPYLQAGFDPKIKKVKTQSWSILLVIAEKPGINSPT